jgi:hypothetical protein
MNEFLRHFSIWICSQCALVYVVGKNVYIYIYIYTCVCVCVCVCDCVLSSHYYVFYIESKNIEKIWKIALYTWQALSADQMLKKLYVLKRLLHSNRMFELLIQVRSNTWFSLLSTIKCFINPVNAELNPICHLLALVGARHFVDVSRIRVKYMWVCVCVCVCVCMKANLWIEYLSIRFTCIE